MIRYHKIAWATLLATAGWTHPALAQSASGDGWYIAASGTGSDLNKPRQTIANAPTPGSTLQVVNAVDFGWGGQVEIGYTYRFVRVEAEIGRTENHSSSYSAIAPIVATLPQDGQSNVTRYMTNLYLEVPRGHWPVSPFIGGGVGVASARVTTVAAPAIAPKAPPSHLLDYKDTVFAYQLIGGVSVPLGRKFALTAQYRWFDAGTTQGVDSRGERATRQIRGSNYDLGIRFNF